MSSSSDKRDIKRLDNEIYECQRHMGYYKDENCHNYKVWKEKHDRAMKDLLVFMAKKQ